MGVQSVSRDPYSSRLREGFQPKEVPLNPPQFWKAWLYPWIPSLSPWNHEKRRKGLLYRACGREVLECQREQDQIFWTKFFHPGKAGTFLEIGGDGVTGSHTLGLELQHDWSGDFCEPSKKPRQHAQSHRKCRVLGTWQEASFHQPVDLLAVHRPQEFQEIFGRVGLERFRPRWVIMENRAPDPQWCRLLEGRGYKLKFYFHDDEYYELQS